MSQEVFIGYQEGYDFHGYLVSISSDDYNHLKKISDNLEKENILSLREIIHLSDVKEYLVKAQIEIWKNKDNFLKDKSLSLEEINDYVGKSLESFDKYRDDIPQMEFLVSSCIIDYRNSVYDEDSNKHIYDYLVEVDKTSDYYEKFYDKIINGCCKRIDISKELFYVLYDWMIVGGREEIVDMFLAEPEKGTLMDLIMWWDENMYLFEYKAENIFTNLLFRTFRNNLVKSKRTGKDIFNSKDWKNLIEII